MDQPLDGIELLDNLLEDSDGDKCVNESSPDGVSNECSSGSPVDETMEVSTVQPEPGEIIESEINGQEVNTFFPSPKRVNEDYDDFAPMIKKPEANLPSSPSKKVNNVGKESEPEPQTCSSCGAPLKMLKTRNNLLAKKFRFRIYQNFCTSLICGKASEKHYKLASGKFEHVPDVDTMNERLESVEAQRAASASIKKESSPKIDETILKPSIARKRGGRKSDAARKRAEMVKNTIPVPAVVPQRPPSSDEESDAKSNSVLIQTDEPDIEGMIDNYFKIHFDSIAEDSAILETIHPVVMKKLVFYNRILESKEKVIKRKDDQIAKLNQTNTALTKMFQKSKLSFMDDLRRVRDMMMTAKGEFKAHHIEMLAETKKNHNLHKKETVIVEQKYSDLELRMRLKEKELQVEKRRVEYEQARSEHYLRQKESKDQSETMARVAHKDIEKKLADSLYISDMSKCPHCQSNEKLRKRMIEEVAESTQEMEKALMQRETMAKQLKKAEKNISQMHQDVQKLGYEARTWRSTSEKHQKTIEHLQEDIARLKRNAKIQRNADTRSTPRTPADNNTCTPSSFIEDGKRNVDNMSTTSEHYPGWVPRKNDQTSASNSPNVSLQEKLRGAQQDIKRKGNGVDRPPHAHGHFDNKAMKGPIATPPVKKPRHDERPPSVSTDVRRFDSVRTPIIPTTKPRAPSPQIRKFGDAIMESFDQSTSRAVRPPSPEVHRRFGDLPIRRPDEYHRGPVPIPTDHYRDPPMRGRMTPPQHYRASSPVYQRGAPAVDPNASLPWHRGGNGQEDHRGFQGRRIASPPRDRWGTQDVRGAPRGEPGWGATGGQRSYWQ